MKVKAPQITRAFDALATAADPKTRLYLLYGPDDSGSRAIAARLDRVMGAEAERIDLDGATLKEDPARLSDEAAAIPLFGGRRHIRVTGGDECTAAVIALLEGTGGGDPVVMIAGALKPASILLKRVLDDPAVMACQSYKPEGSDADDMAIAIGRLHGLRLAGGVARDLASAALGDRGVLERELEKIALYLDAAPDRPREATHATIDAIGAGLDESDTLALVDAVMDGRLPEVALQLEALDDATTGPIPALRALARRLTLLARLRAEVEGGKTISTVMASAGRGMRLRERDSITRQLGRWDALRLRTAAARIFASEAAIKAPGTAGDVLAMQEFVTIARVAERRR